MYISGVCSVAFDRGLGTDFTLEFSEVHSAVIVVIELLKHLGCFLRSDVEATALNNSLNFGSVHSAVSVQVETVEGLVSVEVR